MRKRTRRSSVYPIHQRDKHLEDRISQLPDGILSHILSMLKMREAVCFHAGGEKKERERSKYVAWVNQVLKLHLRTSLDEFRVGVYLDIDEWINFVIPKITRKIPRIPELTKLKHLTLDIHSQSCSRFPWFTSLLEEAPSLHLFKLRSLISSRAILSKTLTSHTHECLKDLEIFGFVNRKLVMYLLQNAINLGKITIDPYHPLDHPGSKKKKEARAHQLREESPSGFKINVLKFRLTVIAK
ncbi:hypothetical protein RHSIM_Rhsim07G0231000 [Rhododendron simsii]|uniref:FBD domain-containing protein n=1 Tax=Rhododendron simsii TaxID=118357 RepID=A0A834GW95_RHOSS|nr:hypothetical protein RHSIM_Rhsim07G0231000 [Rhododendron simsii]